MARRIEAVGAGIALEDSAAAPAQLRSVLEQLLSEDRYVNAARRLADEIAQLPPPSACVAMLESVAGQSA
jgi:UDP:flavonoid glycosyltransferase YjiC (YdhE family)